MLFPVNKKYFYRTTFIFSLACITGFVFAIIIFYKTSNSFRLASMRSAEKNFSFQVPECINFMPSVSLKPRLKSGGKYRFSVKANFAGLKDVIMDVFRFCGDIGCQVLSVSIVSSANFNGGCNVKVCIRM